METQLQCAPVHLTMLSHIWHNLDQYATLQLSNLFLNGSIILSKWEAMSPYILIPIHPLESLLQTSLEIVVASPLDIALLPKQFTCHFHLCFHGSYVSILLELAVSIIHIQLWNKWHCQHSTNFWIHCLWEEEQPNTSLLRQCIAQNDLPYSHKIMSKAKSNIFYRTDM